MKINLKHFIIISALAAAACSTPAPQGEISSSANPRDEIARLTADLSKAQENNVYF